MSDFDNQAEDLADAVERARRMQAAANALGVGKPPSPKRLCGIGGCLYTAGDHELHSWELRPERDRSEKRITYPEYGLMVGTIWRFTFKRCRMIGGHPSHHESWETAPTVTVYAKDEEFAEKRVRDICPPLPHGVTWAFRLLSVEEVR